MLPQDQTSGGRAKTDANDPELTSSQSKKIMSVVSAIRKPDEIDDVEVVETVGSFLPAAICIPRVLLPHNVELRLLLVAQ